jgi:KipI family sensor histidine kinase inhibitor
VRLLPCGDAAVLCEVQDVDAVLALAQSLREKEIAGLVDVVPGARSVLVRVEPGTDLAPLRRDLAEASRRAEDASARSRRGGGDTSARSREQVAIEVVYDGPDLDDVARLTDLTAAEVIAAHTKQPWRVAFGGFAPGFAYLVGGDPRLVVPRRHEPRTTVPAGSVGLAGEYSGVYPRPSPGGWQLIGRTDAVLWDLDRDPPALLRPGAWVRFVARQ